MPVGTPFAKGQSGNPAGLKPGTVHLSTRVRRLLSGDEKLPDAIAEVIRRAVGDDRSAIDAMVIVGLLQALQGDERWAKLLWEYGFGKVPDKQELTGPDEAWSGPDVSVTCRMIRTGRYLRGGT